MEKYFKKKVLLGYLSGEGNVWCDIAFENSDGRDHLSISGQIGSSSFGQIDKHISKNLRGLGIDQRMSIKQVKLFLKVWDKYHNNELQAGTPKQTYFLGKVAKERGLDWLGYFESCAALADAGLNPHNGYYYGSHWLSIKVPQRILNFLQSLPKY